MKAIQFTINRRYLWLELGFIIFLSFAISLISDLEYSAYEEHDISKFSKDFGYRFVTESVSLICYSIYYWGFLKGFVLKRNLVGVIVSSFAFVIINRFIDKYFANWLLIHSEFVTPEFRKRALKMMLDPTLVVTFNYPLISTIFPLTGLAFVVRSFTQDQNLKALKEQQLISELNYLKAQLHPHFFFNTINNIYALALKQSKQTAPMIARLGELMRYILYETEQESVSLSREVEFLASYIEVEKLRHDARTQITYEFQGIGKNHRIEPLLFLPFIENAFKHGLAEETADGFVHIVICRTDQDVTLEVSNSIPQAFDNKFNPGIGIHNVGKRLDILYPDKYELKIHEGPCLYEVTLILTST